MFGHRYFGARYFGPRYWGEGATPVAETPVSRGGIDYREVEKSHRIDRARAAAREVARQAAEELAPRSGARLHWRRIRQHLLSAVPSRKPANGLQPQRPMILASRLQRLPPCAPIFAGF